MKKILLLALTMALLAGAGCGTVANHMQSGRKAYGGVCWDAAFISGGPGAFGGTEIFLLGLLDLPLSLTGDTVLLPYDLIAPQKKTFRLNVFGTSGFTGSCVYVKGRKEIEKQIGDGRRSPIMMEVSGVLKSCVVRKVSDKPGWVQLKILENGKVVFESKRVETDEAISFTHEGAPEPDHI
jgi:uncharacterized protein YceK